MSKVKLGDVAIESREVYKGDKSGMPIVGLEHLTPEDVVLSNWEHDTENTFTKMFRKGDMLFGRRRAYLKKAAQAPFDGICSGDITVIRAKGGKLLPELLPFIIQNENLFDFAVGKSAGSLSPRVKWENLQNFTFELPSLDEQKKLAAVLWSINDTLQAYQNLLKQTDELVKAQFIEIFGDQEDNPFSFTKMKLGEACEFYSGTGFPTKYQGNTDGKYPFFKVGDISQNVQDGYKRLAYAGNYINDDVAAKIHGSIIPEGTVVFAKIGEALRLNRRAITTQECLIDNNAMGIRPKENLNLEYFFSYMQQIDMSEYAGVTAMPSVRKSTLENLSILVPPIETQCQFADISQGCDSSKLSLQNAIAAAQETRRSIIADALKISEKE